MYHYAPEACTVSVPVKKLKILTTKGRHLIGGCSGPRRKYLRF
jgi:hypothetical protein